MDASLAQDKIKTALKQVLKKQSHTYADVAKVWECSVPTVKRQLGPEELPVSRLLTLLEWLNLSLSDLQKLAESEDLASPKYTAKQNEFLAKNPREFSFLMKLYQDFTPEQIAKKYRLTPQILEKILIQLEKNDLIRVGAGGKIKPFYSRTPGVDGPLAQAHMRRIIDRTAQFHKNRISEILDLQARGVTVPRGGLQWHAGEMSARTYNEYLSKMRQLMDDIVAVSKIEEKTLKKSELKMAVVNSGLFLCEMDDKNLPLVADVMDEGLRNPEA